MAKTPSTQSTNQSLTEALEALSALGYSEKEIKRITPKLEELGTQATDEYLRNALKFMMKR